MKNVLYKIVKAILYPIFILVYKPIIIGSENIPNNTSVILAGNHTNNLDAALVIAGCRRVVHMMAKKELFKSKIGKMFFRSMGCISVDRSIHDDNAKAQAIDTLKNGGVIGIFPEGTINKTKDTLLEFKYGAVSLASKTNSYIVPFAICGKYKTFRKSIKIKFAEAYKISKSLESENQILMNNVKKLMEES